MKLKGHEKFPLREGWLNKGIRGVQKNAKVFTSNDGPDILGVGTNMVKSIRYWMQSFMLIEENPKEGVALSGIGKLIEQYDLYLEDYFSLWILHSCIAKNDDRATVWYLFFNKCAAEEFKKDELFDVLKKELIVYAGTDSFPDSSLKDDIDVLLNMYGKNNSDDDPEDKNKSPFAVLGLVKKEKDVYYKQQPDIRKFNEKVVLYELALLLEGQDTVSIDTVFEVVKGIYHLNRVTLNSILDRLENMGYVRVDRTAGLDVIYPVNVGKANEVIEEYYSNR